MRLLLDTHVLLWVLSGQRIAAEARQAIAEPSNDVLLSAASVWEMSIKIELGRLELPKGWMAEVHRQSIELLPVTAEHALSVRDLPPLHRDPFDRMLVAQALREGLTLVTRDAQVQAYEVPTLAA